MVLLFGSSDFDVRDDVYSRAKANAAVRVDTTHGGHSFTILDLDLLEERRDGLVTFCKVVFFCFSA